ncbi:MAG: 5-(carboxyamino)imidazole ribonucleotide synthase [Saprospiraceae bacterium]
MQYKPKDFNIGVLGGGQLGKMLHQESLCLDLQLHFMDSNTSSSVAKVSPHFTQGNINDYNDVYNFGKDKDILTIEIEHVNLDALKDLEELGVKVYPQYNILKIIQDKGMQKEFIVENKFPTAPFLFVQDQNEIHSLLQSGSIQYPFVQKLRRGGYDGKGVSIIRNENDLYKLLEGECIIEKLADIDKEISVIAVRSSSGQTKVYPSVSMDFHPTANLVEFLICPAEINNQTEERAQNLALELLNKLQIVGLLAVEMFLNKDGSIWINEMAPRPHNSGHHTLVNGSISQFSNHLRALVGLQLGDTQGNQTAIMLNLLGEENYFGETCVTGLENVLSVPGIFVYLYGKDETKPFRKMGHVTILDKEVSLCKKKANLVKEHLKIISSN